MKAVRLLEYGGQLVFNDVPTPTTARDEILVKIKSTAVNHLDLVEASGTARQIFPLDLPYGSAMGARGVQQLRETAIELQMAPIRSSVHIPVATLWAHFQAGMWKKASPSWRSKGTL